jgi:multiple sugar transport system substrate-binding protein
VPDTQKYIVAMASNESPDIIEVSNQQIPTYQSAGLLEDIGGLAKKNSFSTDIFGKAALEANSVSGTVYGLPYNSVIIQMFYNKTILNSIGYTAPPATMEELYEMAVKATTLDGAGNIDILGYPLFPLASARQELIYAFGGTWTDSSGKKATPNSPGVLASLKLNAEYRNRYGADKVQRFVATSNTNRYSPQDIFFAGKQLFRFDGPWLSKMIADNNPALDYGVALIPGTKANPGLRGVSRYETASIVIPRAGKNKDGAWALAKFLVTEGAKDLCLGMRNLPANKNLYTDKDLLSLDPSFPMFMEALKTENGIQYPKLEESAKYTSLIEEHLDYVYNGTKTPEEAMNALQQQASQLR